MKPLYIFDLDGTLALTEHRQHFINPEPIRNEAGEAVMRGKPDWRAFFAACVDDEPNTPVIDTLLRLLDCGCDVRIWSGRSAEVMEQTNAWLSDYLGGYVHGVELTMRLEGDYRPDEELKKLWLDDLTAYDRRRLVAVFDDRDKVVAMWRANGVPCFQVAPGAF